MFVHLLRAVRRFPGGLIAVAIVAFVPASLAYEWMHPIGTPTAKSASQVMSSPASERTALPTSTATPAPSPTATTLPATPVRASLANIRANELGKVMVLEYHVIGDQELRWTRTRENFRKDLEYLYGNGYYLIGLNQLLDNRVDVPAGKTPAVLTFDDSNRSQFQFVVGADGVLKPDPASALGILEEFIAQHPDFGRSAVFCVLPSADPPNDLFGQKEYRQQKLRYLVDSGYEICNHTLWHADLGTVSADEAVKQIALATKAIQDLVPGYKVNTFNPPHGAYPENPALMLSGSFEGTSYRHRAVLKVGGGPLTAPDRRGTDFIETPRIQAIPSELDLWFGYFEQHPEERYVSDGDPHRLTFPARLIEDYVPPAGAHEELSPDPAYKVIRLR